MMPLQHPQDSSKQAEAGARSGEGLQLSARMRGGMSDCAVRMLLRLLIQVIVLVYNSFVALLALGAASDARAEAEVAAAVGQLPTCISNYVYTELLTTPNGDESGSWADTDSTLDASSRVDGLRKYTPEELAELSENWEDMIHACRMYGQLGLLAVSCWGILLCAVVFLVGKASSDMGVSSAGTTSGMVMGGCAAVGYCCMALAQFVFTIMFWVERGNANIIECQANESFRTMNRVFWHSIIAFIVNCAAGVGFRLEGQKSNLIEAWP